MDEIYRMLGRERQADLDREALAWQHARALRSQPSLAIGLWRALAKHAPGHKQSRWRAFADRLACCRKAVQNHLAHVYRKLGIRSRTELALLLATAPADRRAGGLAELAHERIVEAVEARDPGEETT
jgi:hypothetical protein